MAEANDVYGSIYQNLFDAGCDRQTAEQRRSRKWKTKTAGHLKLTLKLR